MSGSGKSYWSEKLARHGFRRFCLDALIAQKLSAELRREDGSILTLGEWMGFPFQEGYQRREDLYLSTEKQLMAETLDWIDENVCTGLQEKNVVLDTTGSVIYTGDSILKRLRSLTTSRQLHSSRRDQGSNAAAIPVKSAAGAVEGTVQYRTWRKHRGGAVSLL